MRLPLILALFLAAASWPARAAQTVYPAAGWANPLDGENPFARAQALGSAFAGVADDGSALYSNPAGLAYLESPQVLSGTGLWLVDSFEQDLLAAFPLAPGAGAAVAGRYLGFGSLPGYDASGTATGSYGADRLGLSAGAGIELWPGWAAGLQAQMDRDRLDQTLLTDFTWGLGVLGRLSPRLSLGASFHHAGWGASGQGLPGILEIGAAWRADLGARQSLLAALGGTWEAGQDGFVQGGLEYGWARVFFLRLGARRAFQDQGTGIGLTAGAGADLGDLQLDYAYAPYGDLGSSHRFTVGYRFPPARPAPTPTAVVWPVPPDLPPVPPETENQPTPVPAGDRLSVAPGQAVDPLT
ncbi:MAG TPA: hypothetical protein VFR02_01995, partial [bacterium]|nr:hypothetical protein [bacterium]